MCTNSSTEQANVPDQPGVPASVASDGSPGSSPEEQWTSECFAKLRFCLDDWQHKGAVAILEGGLGGSTIPDNARRWIFRLGNHHELAYIVYVTNLNVDVSPGTPTTNDT